MRTYLQKAMCPACRTQLARAYVEGPKPPQAYDYTLCCVCGEFLEFRADGSVVLADIETAPLTTGERERILRVRRLVLTHQN